MVLVLNGFTEGICESALVSWLLEAGDVTVCIEYVRGE